MHSASQAIGDGFQLIVLDHAHLDDDWFKASVVEEWRGDQAKRLKDLEKENGRLRKAISDLTLDKLILKEALEGNC